MRTRQRRRIVVTVLIAAVALFTWCAEAVAGLPTRPPTRPTRTPARTATPPRATPTPPPGAPTPRPTEPSVLSPELRCQQGVREASTTLAASTRRLLGRCIALGSQCLDDPTSADDCCAASAPACVQDLEVLAAARAIFASRLRQACLVLPFRRMVDPTGLGYGSVIDACDRLDPPLPVSNRKELGACLAQILVEDVAHVLAGTEQPRALDALLCMDVASRVSGVARDDPATCFPDGEGPAPTPSPAPTSGGEPTPTPNGGASPTPAPSSANPTPTPPPAACSRVEVTVSTSYTQTDVSGVTANVVYPASVAMPGFDNSPEVLARVTNLTGISGGIFNVGDQDDTPGNTFVNVGLASISQPIPAGPFARIRFDCNGGAVSAAQFACAPVRISNLLGEESDSPCALAVSVVP